MNDKQPEFNDDQFTDELISAYLDNELSPEERSLVEDQLIDNPEHRRMFEELRALHEGLQELPQAKLDGGFTDRVMRRAEQEMTASQGDDSSAESPTESNQVTPAANVRDGQDSGVLRGLVWAVAAMAAAIAIIVFNPLAKLGDRGVVVNTEEKAVNSKADESNEELTKRLEDGSEAQANKEKGNRDQQPAGDIINNLDNRIADRADREVATGRDVPGVDATDKLANRAASNIRQRNAGGIEPELSPSRNDPSHHAGGEADQVAALDRQKEMLRGHFGGEGGTAFTKPLAEIADLKNPQLTGLASSVQVVEVEVPAEALSKFFVDQALTRNGIEVQLAEVSKQTSGETEQMLRKARDDQRGRSARRETIGDGQAGALKDQIADAAAQDKRSGEKLDAADNKASKLAQQTELDVVYVVATADQVQALVADLRSPTPLALEELQLAIKAENNLAYRPSPVVAVASQPNQNDGQQAGGQQQGQNARPEGGEKTAPGQAAGGGQQGQQQGGQRGGQPGKVNAEGIAAAEGAGQAAADEQFAQGAERGAADAELVRKTKQQWETVAQTRAFARRMKAPSDPLRELHNEQRANTFQVEKQAGTAQRFQLEQPVAPLQTVEVKEAEAGGQEGEKSRELAAAKPSGSKKESTTASTAEPLTELKGAIEVAKDKDAKKGDAKSQAQQPELVRVLLVLKASPALPHLPAAKLQPAAALEVESPPPADQP